MTWVKVAEEKDVPSGGCRVVYVEDVPIALFNIDGKFYAIENECKHAGGPLGEGWLDGSVVTCPLHGWKYDVTTGDSVDPEGYKQARYNVKVEGGSVFVKV